MVNKSKNLGTAAETAVVRYLVANGFPQAERRPLKGALDQGDITGTPGICWEVKGGQAAKTASDGLVAAWLLETGAERINANADVGILVLQRAGIGAVRAGQWWAILPSATFAQLVGAAWHGDASPVRLHVSDVVRLLRLNGYGDQLEEAS